MWVLVIFSALVTLFWTGIVILADSMSDAPSVDGLSVLPPLLIGGTITGVLLIAWLVG